jgi:hypothetical protein
MGSGHLNDVDHWRQRAEYMRALSVGVTDLAAKETMPSEGGGHTFESCRVRQPPPTASDESVRRCWP